MRGKNLFILIALLSCLLYSCHKEESLTSSKKKSERGIANNGMSLSGDYIKRNNPELSGLINDLLEVKTSESLYQFLKKVDTGYDSLKTVEAKYFALQISMMIPAKGIFWRLDGLFSSYLGDGRLDTTNTAQNLYSALIGRIAVFSKIFSGFSDSNHWLAGYDYLAKPNESFTFNSVQTSKSCNKANYGNKKSSHFFGNSFKDERDFRAFLACEYYPALSVAEKRLKGLLSSQKIKKMTKSADFIAWDNKVIFGADSFDPNLGEDIDRIRKITGGDVYALMASIESMKASTESLIAYKLKGLVAIVNKTGQVIASPGIRLMGDSIKGKWNAEKQSEIIGSQKSFLKAEESDFYGGDYKYWMGKALSSVEKWWSYADKSKRIYEDTESFFKHDDTQVVLNPALIGFVGRSLNLTNNSMKDMIFNNESIVQSISNGKKVRFKFREIYLNPAKNLQVYLPTKWKGAVGMRKRSFRSRTLRRKITHSDYLAGSSIMWNIGEYKRIFPKVETEEDLREASRLLGQSWGGLTGLAFLNQIFL